MIERRNFLEIPCFNWVCGFLSLYAITYLCEKIQITSYLLDGYHVYKVQMSATTSLIAGVKNESSGVLWGEVAIEREWWGFQASRPAPYITGRLMTYACFHRMRIKLIIYVLLGYSFGTFLTLKKWENLLHIQKFLSFTF